MSRWVTTANIQDFREKLATATDPEKRRILVELLAKEEERLRVLEDGERRDR